MLVRIIFFVFIPFFVLSQNTYSLAVLKYNGGGDWNANPTALPNLIEFTNKNIGTNIKKNPEIVDVGSLDIYNFPFIHMTGHGNVIFNNEEANNLRKYLLSGGFLHVDDNYGMDEFFRRELKKVFPEKELVKINFNHNLFNQSYKFPNGLPKIHIHDAKPAEALGVFDNGRLICLYTYESDLSDGWEYPEVHNDSY